MLSPAVTDAAGTYFRFNRLEHHISDPQVTHDTSAGVVSCDMLRWFAYVLLCHITFNILSLRDSCIGYVCNLLMLAADTVSYLLCCILLPAVSVGSKRSLYLSAPAVLPSSLARSSLNNKPHCNKYSRLTASHFAAFWGTVRMCKTIFSKICIPLMLTALFLLFRLIRPHFLYDFCN